MMRILLYIFLIYLAYQFIFRFLIPVYRTTKQVKKGFREMQEKMNQNMNQSQQAQNSQASKDKDSKEQVGEYIDFEEIK